MRGLSVGLSDMSGRKMGAQNVIFIGGIQTTHRTEIIHQTGGRHTKPMHGPAVPTRTMTEEHNIWGEGMVTITKDYVVERGSTDALVWEDDDVGLGGIMVTRDFDLKLEVDTTSHTKIHRGH